MEGGGWARLLSLVVVMQLLEYYWGCGQASSGQASIEDARDVSCTKSVLVCESLHIQLAHPTGIAYRIVSSRGCRPSAVIVCTRWSEQVVYLAKGDVLRGVEPIFFDCLMCCGMRSAKGLRLLCFDVTVRG